MSKKNTTKIIVFLLMTVVLPISCRRQANKNKLYIGTNAEFEPFEYRDGNKIVGFDMDLMAEIAKIIGKEIEIIDMNFDGLLPALEAKKIDIIIAGMTATEERKQFVNFSDPYYDSKQSIVIWRDNSEIISFNDFIGKKIGVVLGFTGDILVSKMTDVAIKRFNATSEAILALKSRKVDAIVLDYEAARNYVAQNPELKLLETNASVEKYSIAIRKDNIELMNSINDALKIVRKNGIYDKLIGNYF